MLKVVWTARAHSDWSAAMARSPKGDEVLYTDAIAGSSQAEMLAEYSWISRDKTFEDLLAIGESRETYLKRIWCSELGFVYGFVIDHAAGIFTIFYFCDARSPDRNP